MSRLQKAPLRPLTPAQQQHLEQGSRSLSAPAVQVERARILLAVAAGHSHTQAAARVGRKSGDAVSQLVGRFNQEAMAALIPRHGGGFPGAVPGSGAGTHPR